MDLYDILKKYNLDDEVEEEFRLKTINHRGATDLVTKFKICSKIIDKKRIEIRKKLEKLQSAKICCEFENIADSNKVKCKYCNNYIGISNNCKSCDFYNNEVLEYETQIKELIQASKLFEEKATNEFWSN